MDVDGLIEKPEEVDDREEGEKSGYNLQGNVILVSGIAGAGKRTIRALSEGKE